MPISILVLLDKQYLDGSNSQAFFAQGDRMMIQRTFIATICITLLMFAKGHADTASDIAKVKTFLDARVADARAVYDKRVTAATRIALGRFVSIARLAARNGDLAGATDAWREVLTLDRDNEDARRYFTAIGQLDKVLGAIRSDLLDASVEGEWTDLTTLKFNLDTSYPLGINEVPNFMKDHVTQIQDQGYFLDGQTYLIVHGRKEPLATARWGFEESPRLLRAKIGLIHVPGRCENVARDAIFRVFADGKEVFTSDVVEPGEKPLDVIVKLPQAKVLELKTGPGPNGVTNCSYCVWIDPQVK